MKIAWKVNLTFFRILLHFLMPFKIGNFDWGLEFCLTKQFIRGFDLVVLFHLLSLQLHFSDFGCFQSAYIQYCAKVTQAKCANFVLCLRELSRKVRAKVRVTIQDLLSEISLEQRTLFRWTFGTKRNFTMTSIISLAQCPKFRVRQAQQFLTRSIRSSRHVTYAKYTEGFQRTL